MLVKSIFAIFLAALQHELGHSIDRSSLYSEKDPIVILNNGNFNNIVLGTETFWVVEFYNSWCGHCIKFAPTMKEFAQDMTGIVF